MMITRIKSLQIYYDGNADSKINNVMALYIADLMMEPEGRYWNSSIVAG